MHTSLRMPGLPATSEAGEPLEASGPAAVEPVVKFYRAAPACRMPLKADPSALGTLPVAAYRHCAAAVAASAFGWYVFAPMRMQLVLSEGDILWSRDEGQTWMPLDSAQFPGFSQYWDEHAEPSLRDCAPPMLAKTHHPGVIQLWSGLFVSSRADWSILVRSPANLQNSGSLQIFEGIIETDHWFGPLFINAKLLRTDYPIVLDTEFPLFQVQPIPRIAHAPQTLQSAQYVEAPLDFPAEGWRRYHDTLLASRRITARTAGSYAATVRKRAREAAEPEPVSCPFSSPA